MDSRDESESGEAHRPWFRENSADTRRPDGPEPRLYATPFYDAWGELIAYARERRGWDVTHADDSAGLISVRCASRVFRFIDDLTIWMTLDENGLTRVDALSQAQRGISDFGVNRRRIDRMLRSLDEALGPEARLDMGAPNANSPQE